MDLHKVLQHELMTVPVSLAYPNGSLRVGSKTVLTDVLTKDVTCPPEITLDGTSCLVIDGQALVVALGKPSGVTISVNLETHLSSLLLMQGVPLTGLMSLLIATEKHRSRLLPEVNIQNILVRSEELWKIALYQSLLLE